MEFARDYLLKENNYSRGKHHIYLKLEMTVGD